MFLNIMPLIFTYILFGKFSVFNKNEPPNTSHREFNFYSSKFSSIFLWCFLCLSIYEQLNIIIRFIVIHIFIIFILVHWLILFSTNCEVSKWKINTFNFYAMNKIITRKSWEFEFAFIDHWKFITNFYWYHVFRVISFVYSCCILKPFHDQFFSFTSFSKNRSEIKFSLERIWERRSVEIFYSKCWIIMGTSFANKYIYNLHITYIHDT